ncbi:glycosyltransferase family A protein [Actinopolymorpha rutila]|uniref:Glycosyltransferase involved in cell wall biosynthesis n=1 Tax=Actinopolymorpha rutila TaxID=446787 RepID=A0A852Z8C2_9ACTN|nr:glycosyltransferase involved in cell wall biosynthesis [Actinopolymorpha rutila]
MIVPVYNPGRYLEDCIASLMDQDMPAGDFEVIFVDDGSTDGSPRRLDDLAATHPFIRVIHQANSGWSGKPRNVGIEAAHGEYVFFLDNDDLLGQQALRRMYAFAKANDSDIVVGKMVGKGRGVPRELFRKTYPTATLSDAPLIDSLTPHKLFRRSFLDKHGLRFPEGRRRLEDHVFVIAAYFAADTISVLSDYVCYYHVRRDDDSNAGFERLEPESYFGFLREALDVVEANTEPGPLRDRLYRRWYRVEMLERLRGKRLLDTPAVQRGPLLHEIRKVVAERFGPGVAAPLAPTHRVIGSLAQAGLLDDLVSFANWENDIAAAAQLDDVGWQAGTLQLTLTAELRNGGELLTFAHRDGRDALGVYSTLSPAGQAALTEADLDCTSRLQKSKVDVLARDRDTRAEYLLPTTFNCVRHPVAEQGAVFGQVFQAKAAVDIATAASGRPLPTGTWDLFVRLTSCGWTKETRLGSHRSDAATYHCVPAVLANPDTVVTPYRTDKGNLTLDVGNHTNRLDSLHIMRELPQIGYGDNSLDLHISVPLTAVVPQPVNGSSALRLTQNTVAGSVVTIPAALTPAETTAAAGSILLARHHGELDPGRWSVEVRLTAGTAFVRLPATVITTTDGVPTVEALSLPARRTPGAKTPGGDAWKRSVLTGRRLAGRVRRWARSSAAQ